MKAEMKDFIAMIGRRIGQPEPEVITEAVITTIRTLGSHLHGVPLIISTNIPFFLHYDLYAGQSHPSVGPAALYMSVSNKSGLEVTTTVELVQAVVSEFSGRLDTRARHRLRLLLPPPWAAMVSEAEAEEGLSDSVPLGDAPRESVSCSPPSVVN